MHMGYVPSNCLCFVLACVEVHVLMSLALEKVVMTRLGFGAIAFLFV
jgi:hypothetical protein